MEIFTIGHSTHPLENFLGLLVKHGIDTLVDVRSVPFSRFAPDYNQTRFKERLENLSGVTYAYAGEILGGRSPVDARSPIFEAAMGKVLSLSAGRYGFRVALMCSEHDPAMCHRAGKLTRWLHVKRPEVSTTHILRDGSLVDAKRYEPKVRKRMRDMTLGEWPKA